MSLRELDVPAKRVQIIEQLDFIQLLASLCLSTHSASYILHDPLGDLPDVDIPHDLFTLPFPLEGDDECFELVDRGDGYSERSGF